MGLIVKLFGLVFLLAILAIGGLVAYAKQTGLKSHGRGGALETELARSIRSLAIPTVDKQRVNPFIGSREAVNEGLQHFARYCAMCHANDGSGERTPIGQGLFPKPPDMRSAVTQRLTDGELFYIIENGVRFTGMPAFGTGERSEAGERQTWQLVTFIRQLPTLTPAQIGWMQGLNPL